jgi:benzodiazapine receptor
MSTVKVVPTSALTATQRPLELRHILNIAAFVAVVVVNVLANTLPLNGISTGEISDSFPSLVTPAGYVFSIWGFIYLLLAAFVVYQALPAHRGNARLERLGYLFVVSCALNIAWLFAWHYLQFPLTLPLMLGLLVTLILIYQRLEIGQSDVSRGESLAVRLAFSVYLGWITVATVANVTVVLLDLGVQSGWTAPFWAVVALALVTAVGLTVLRRRGDVAFVGVLIWAFLGIAVRQWGSDALLVLAAAGAAAYLAYEVLWHVRSSKPVHI